MTPDAYEISALRRRIEEMEKELRKLKGIKEPEHKRQTFKEVVGPGIEKIFDEIYREQ
jgi:GMP synthase PP-ATPase subunit